MSMSGTAMVGIETGLPKGLEETQGGPESLY